MKLSRIVDLGMDATLLMVAILMLMLEIRIAFRGSHGNITEPPRIYTHTPDPHQPLASFTAYIASWFVYTDLKSKHPPNGRTASRM